MSPYQQPDLDTFKFQLVDFSLWNLKNKLIHNKPRKAESIVFQPAIEILRNDHKTSSHFVIGADMICSIKASVEMLFILPDEHVFGPGQNAFSIPK